MNLSMLYPLIYLTIGIALGKTRWPIRQPAAALLSKYVIPIVIVYNLATYQTGIGTIMLAMMVMMASILLIAQMILKDGIRSLCLCYLNIGWLGLPIVSSLFGDGAAQVFIAAYIGSSLFGNSVGLSVLINDHHFKQRIVHTLKTPPIIALMIGIALMPFGDNIQAAFGGIYVWCKWLMGFLGMMILGIWLSHIPIQLSYIKQESRYFLIRLMVFAVLITLLIQFGKMVQIDLITQNQKALYLLAILPPAANIVILETHYLKSGRSAPMIACGTCVSLLAIGVYVMIMILI